MNILIIGDNANSRILSKKLVLLSHSITVIGNNIENLKQIEEQIDAKIIIGKPCSPSTLKQADNKDIDLIIAISDQDETNIVACKTAFTLFISFFS